MSISKKMTTSNISTTAETRNLSILEEKTGNIYKAIAIISKRSNQIASGLKTELHSKLEEFASSTDNLEEVFENREQIEISRYYERMPNATLLAIQEFVSGEIYYRDPAGEEK